MLVNQLNFLITSSTITIMTLENSSVSRHIALNNVTKKKKIIDTNVCSNIIRNKSSWLFKTLKELIYKVIPYALDFQRNTFILSIILFLITTISDCIDMVNNFLVSKAIIVIVTIISVARLAEVCNSTTYISSI